MLRCGQLVVGGIATAQRVFLAFSGGDVLALLSEYTQNRRVVELRLLGAGAGAERNKRLE